VTVSASRSDMLMNYSNCYCDICIKSNRIKINFVSSANIRYFYAYSLVFVWTSAVVVTYVWSFNNFIQSDRKVSVHLMITIQKVKSNIQSVPRQCPDIYWHYLTQSDCLAVDRQGQRYTSLTLTPSVIPNYNYVTMVSDWNCLKYFCVFLYCNQQVHRDFMITL
jgi:hypothetical protein